MADFHVHIERVGDDVAATHWRAAPNTTVFTCPEVLRALSPAVEWWLAIESGVPVSLWPVCVDTGGIVLRPEFGYYVGPFDLLPPDPSPQRRLRLAVAIHEAFLEKLTAVYDRLAWSTQPGQHELRPWLWFPGSDRHLAVRPRYTAVIDRLDTSSDEDILRRFRRRRDEYRRGKQSGVVNLPGVSLDRLVALYYETLEANGEGQLARARSEAVEKLYGLVSSGHGAMIACGYHADDEPRAAWLMMTAKGRACGVLGVAEPSWREKRLNAFGTFAAVAAARQGGASVYDFNGANSFQRGADKHSYGAEAELYFDLEWNSAPPA